MTLEHQRAILEVSQIHSTIRESIAKPSHDLVPEVHAAIHSNAVVVVGMRQNPVCSKACRALDAQGVDYKYMEYGSYFSRWRDRNTLKMWTGWPTFPMVFVQGVLVGGANDLNALIASGELKQMVNP
jgi:glutaredoxin-related protein